MDDLRYDGGEIAATDGFCARTHRPGHGAMPHLGRLPSNCAKRTQRTHLRGRLREELAAHNARQSRRKKTKRTQTPGRPDGRACCQRQEASRQANPPRTYTCGFPGSHRCAGVARPPGPVTRLTCTPGGKQPITRPPLRQPPSERRKCAGCAGNKATTRRAAAVTRKVFRVRGACTTRTVIPRNSNLIGLSSCCTIGFGGTE